MRASVRASATCGWLPNRWSVSSEWWVEGFGSNRRAYCGVGYAHICDHYTLHVAAAVAAIVIVVAAAAAVVVRKTTMW